MAATLYTSKYLCLNILSTDVKDGQIHLNIMKIRMRTSKLEMEEFLDPETVLGTLIRNINAF